MPSVIVEASGVDCGHGGKVATAAVAPLTVAGSRVLIKADVAGRPVAGCGTAPATNPNGSPKDIPCLICQSVTAGEATRLTVAGMPVLLDTVAGTTNGQVDNVTPQNKLKAKPPAGPSRLTAV